ncbi:hypothetical protein EYF80_056634 [Liparis tanakae]|uniref:Uncharacterized protein n=1 Tax=Liparis tanakae TaxID=230148 RepID=A0A4Z2EX52_9TELE|nr:hypothetical protein EYF80_056634 [Liparis tanakae]
MSGHAPPSSVESRDTSGKKLRTALTVGLRASLLLIITGSSTATAPSDRGSSRLHGGPPLTENRSRVRYPSLFFLDAPTSLARLRRGGAAAEEEEEEEEAATGGGVLFYSAHEPNGGPRGVVGTVGDPSPAGGAGAGAVRG